MKRLEELRKQLQALLDKREAERKELHGLAAADSDLDEVQEKRYKELELRFSDENGRAVWVDDGDIASLRKQIGALNAVVRGFEKDHVETPAGPTVITRDATDPQTRGTEYAAPAEVRSLALKAIERAEGLTDQHRESAEQVLRNADMPDGRLARHILTTGRNAYLSAFRKVMARASDLLTDEERQAVLEVRANSLADSAGGYAIPFTLDPTVIDTAVGLGRGHRWREYASVTQITTDNWNGLSSAGVSARMTGEAVEAIDAAPTFAQPSIPVRKAEAFVVYTEEIYADWPAYDSEIRKMFANAKDELEDLQFTLGSGTGNNVQGIVTGLVAATTPIVASVGSNTFTLPDISAMENALPRRFRSNARWLSSRTVFNVARGFDTAGGAALWTTLGNGLPERLWGYPIEEVDNMDSTYGSGENYVAIFGDIMQTYKIVDRIGATIRNYDDLRGTTNGYPNGTGGLRMVWRFGAAVLNPIASKILNIT